MRVGDVLTHSHRHVHIPDGGIQSRLSNPRWTSLPSTSRDFFRLGTPSGTPTYRLYEELCETLGAPQFMRVSLRVHLSLNALIPLKRFLSSQHYSMSSSFRSRHNARSEHCCQHLLGGIHVDTQAFLRFLHTFVGFCSLARLPCYVRLYPGCPGAIPNAPKGYPWSSRSHQA